MPLLVPVWVPSPPATPESSSPPSSEIFSSAVSSASSSSARLSGDSVVSHHGRVAGSPQRPSAPAVAGSSASAQSEIARAGARMLRSFVTVA